MKKILLILMIIVSASRIYAEELQEVKDETANRESQDESEIDIENLVCSPPCQGGFACIDGTCIGPENQPQASPQTEPEVTNRNWPRKRIWIGIRAGLGATNAFGSLYDTTDELKNEGAVSGHFALDAHFYFTKNGAVITGLSLCNKGFRTKIEGIDFRDIVTYLEFPVGVKGDFNGFQVGTAFALAAAVAGKTRASDGDAEAQYKWTDEDWAVIQRANLAWKGYIGYATRGRNAAFTVDAEVTLHVLNDLKDVEDYESRYLNFWLNLGVAFIIR